MAKDKSKTEVKMIRTFDRPDGTQGTETDTLVRRGTKHAGGAGYTHITTIR